jgi:L-amino acid N-acyltransferase YncA
MPLRAWRDRPYVQDTAISWEIDVPTVGEMAARIDGLRATHEWLVLERDDRSSASRTGSH